MSRYIIVFVLCLLAASCRPPVYSPKPAGYYHIDLPTQHTYQLFDRPGFPYTFEYPTYSNIEQDTMFFNEKPENPYWINIDFPNLGGKINITYKVISATQPYDKLLEDTHKLSYFHDKKADNITPETFANPNGVSGVLFYVSGNAASSYQFMASDSIKHFIHGALYFDVTPNADSLKPVTDFISEDIRHMLMTMKWRN